MGITPITYTEDGGYYVIAIVEPDGTYTPVGQSADKTATSITATGLEPGTEYTFVVWTFTPAHANNQNDLTSLPSAPFTTTTLPWVPVGEVLESTLEPGVSAGDPAVPSCMAEVVGVEFETFDTDAFVEYFVNDLITVDIAATSDGFEPVLVLYQNGVEVACVTGQNGFAQMTRTIQDPNTYTVAVWSEFGTGDFTLSGDSLPEVVDTLPYAAEVDVKADSLYQTPFPEPDTCGVQDGQQLFYGILDTGLGAFPALVEQGTFDFSVETDMLPDNFSPVIGLRDVENDLVLCDNIDEIRTLAPDTRYEVFVVGTLPSDISDEAQLTLNIAEDFEITEVILNIPETPGYVPAVDTPEEDVNELTQFPDCAGIDNVRGTFSARFNTEDSKGWQYFVNGTAEITINVETRDPFAPIVAFYERTSEGDVPIGCSAAYTIPPEQGTQTISIDNIALDRSKAYVVKVFGNQDTFGDVAIRPVFSDVILESLSLTHQTHTGASERQGFVFEQSASEVTTQVTRSLLRDACGLNNDEEVLGAYKPLWFGGGWGTIDVDTVNVDITITINQGFIPVLLVTDLSAPADRPDINCFVGDANGGAQASVIALTAGHQYRFDVRAVPTEGASADGSDIFIQYSIDAPILAVDTLPFNNDVPVLNNRHSEGAARHCE